MPAEITIRLPNLEHVLSRLQPSLYRPAIAEMLRSASLLGERAARENALEFRDTGALARSILVVPIDAMRVQIGTPFLYGEVMESGRRPGARPPPTAALLGWMNRHGIDQRFAWVIARAIGRRGIAGRFFMRRAAQLVEEALPRLMEEAAERIRLRWGDTSP